MSHNPFGTASAGAEPGPVLLVGAGGLAREVVPLLAEQGNPIVGVLDDRHASLPAHVGGVPVLGPLDAVLEAPHAHLVVTVGSSTARRIVVRRLLDLDVAPDRFATVVDPTVRNPGRCRIGRGTILLAGVTITADATLGDHVVAMPGVTITHDCVVGDFATFAAGVSLGGACIVGEGAYLGMNSSVRQGVTVGAASTVGMGAVVLADVPPGETWVGVPARPLPTAMAE